MCLCLPGITGCAAQFYPQIKELGKKGYHIMSVIWPPLYSVQEWAKAFDRFLDSVKVVKVHLVADGLGAFLAQYYTQFDRQFKSPGMSRRGESLFLINGFSNTQCFADNAPAAAIGMVSLIPQFGLKMIVQELACPTNSPQS